MAYAQRTDGLDQRAIDAAPQVFAKWQAEKSAFDAGKSTAAPQGGGYASSLMDVAKKNTITPTDVAFDESKGVAGRVSAITNSASPLMETARTKAKQYSASRGLLNSTLAGQAGEQAVIETATPIANADAGLYQQQSLTNQAARNSAPTQNANNALTAGVQGSQMDVSQDQASKSLMEQGRQFDSTLTDNASMFDRELGEKARQFGLTQSQQLELQRLDNISKVAMADTEAKYKTEIQSSANIANAWGTVMQGIAAIQTDPTLGGDTKKTLIENNLSQFSAYSEFWKKATGGTADVSDLLKFNVVGTTETGSGGAQSGDAPSDANVNPGDLDGNGTDDARDLLDRNPA